MAINLVNSVLVLGSEEDVTCTIDMSIVDLFSGEVEFVKIGAAPTYLRRESRLISLGLLLCLRVFCRELMLNWPEEMGSGDSYYGDGWHY